MSQTNKTELLLKLDQQLALTPNPTGILVYSENIDHKLIDQVTKAVEALKATPAITTQETASQVNDVLGRAKRLVKTVEDAGLQMRRPIKEITDKIMSNEKNVLASLHNLIVTVNTQVTNFQISEDKRQREEQDRIRKEQADKLKAEQDRINTINSRISQLQENVLNALSVTTDIDKLKEGRDKLYKLVFLPDKYDEFLASLETKRTGWVQLFDEKIARLEQIKEDKETDGVDDVHAIDQLKQNEEITISQVKNETTKEVAEVLNNTVANVQMATELKTSVVTGASGVRRQHKYTGLEDISKVPLEYLMVNEAAVKAAIKGGRTEIPGLKIEETITNVSR